MTDHRKINPGGDQIIAMMSDRSGLWDITDERIAMICGKVGTLSASGRRAAMEMIDIAKSDQKVWICKAEYFALLHEIQIGLRKPTQREVLEAVDLLERSAKADRVDHREWVNSTLSILRRLADAI